MGRRAVFLDKDGTLLENIPYNIDPRLMKFTKNAAQGLRDLHAAGYGLVIVSNQSGVARGFFSEDALKDVEASLREMIAMNADAPLAGFYYCPHHPDGTSPEYAFECECRKPRPGMFIRAARELDIDLDRSWMIGDILDDIEAGKKASCKTILIDNGNETEWRLSPVRIPHFVAKDLQEAAEKILAVQEGF